MDIITGYKGRAHVTAEQDRAVNQGVFGEGSYVLSVGQMMRAEIASNTEIRIYDGVLSHQGCAASIRKNAYDSVTIANGSQGMKRKDLVVARYTRDAGSGVENIEWNVIQGTPSASAPELPLPTPGDIQAGDTVADMPMYIITMDGINMESIESLFSIHSFASSAEKVDYDNSGTGMDATNVQEAIDETYDLIKKIVVPELTTDGLSPMSGNCTIDNGGYLKIGKLVIVQLQLTAKKQFAANVFSYLLNGMPRPLTENTTLMAASDSAWGTARGAFVASDGAMIIQAGTTAINANAKVYVSGFYYAQ